MKPEQDNRGEVRPNLAALIDSLSNPPLDEKSGGRQSKLRRARTNPPVKVHLDHVSWVEYIDQLGNRIEP